MNRDEGRLSSVLRYSPSLSLQKSVDLGRPMRAIETLLEVMGKPESKEERENARAQLEKLQCRIRDDDWQECPLRGVMEAADHAFSVEFGQDPAFDDVRQFLLRELEVTDLGGFINPMVRIYIETFDRHSAWSLELAHILGRRKAKIEDVFLPGWRKLFRAVPVLFDPAKAPQHIARMMTHMRFPWDELHAFGLLNPHAAGLMGEAHWHFVDMMQDRLDQPEEIDRMLAWLKPERQSQPLERGAALAVTALLSSWEEPEETIKKKLTKTLVQAYGHPAAREGFVWLDVDKKYKQIFLRWLMKEDYQVLLKVLDSDNPSHMWGSRREFWQNLLEEGHIRGLWVAFDPDRYEYAERFLPKERFGCQVYGTEKGTSLLLIEIADKIVVEGTSSFSMRIFNERDAGRPKLYEKTYHLGEMRKSQSNPDKIPHLGRWQDKAMARIFQ